MSNATLSTEDIAVQDPSEQPRPAEYQGLTSDEAQQRLAQDGPNAIPEKKVSVWRQLGSYFWGPIPWMIEIAALLSIVVGHWVDLSIIVFMLVFNAGLSFWEEYKASNALDALKSQLALKARALRDGKWTSVPASDLVRGDVIRLRLGDIVPADAKLLDGDFLSIDQAALTGESLPVSKKPGDVAYSGSAVKQGEMVAEVSATGGNTFFGRTARLVQDAGAVSHFQRAVMRIGNFLIFVALALSVVLVGVELYRATPVLDLLQFVLILVIAAIPVAMPAVLSVTMALGALSLSKEKAIVSRLQAIEEMAGIDILCSDKTGTLTKNQLTLADPVLVGAADNQECILAAALASKEEDQDAIDLAVIGGLADRATLDAYRQDSFTPFDPIHKRTEATATDPDGKQSRYTKGAPQVIFDLCQLDGDARKQAEQSVNELAGKGYRTLGVARTDASGNWRMLGILPMFDPPRDDSASTIAQAREHGIDVKMVTGDNTAIARETCAALGLGTDIQPATRLFGDGEDTAHVDDAKARRIEEAEGFAEVFPEHKYGIVKALQQRGHLVAMTGDGVNDAPALKQADAGVAVSGATDAARAAADLVLTAPGLSVIIKAVETARQIFVRMLTYTVYRIAMTIDIMFFVVLATCLYGFRPISAVMIILLALLDDIPMMSIAYDNTHINKKPVSWDMRRVLITSSVLGVLAVVQTFGLFALGMEWQADPAWQQWFTTNFGVAMDTDHLRSMMFLQLVVGGHLMLFVTRTKHSLLTPPYPSWQLFSAVLGTQVLAAMMCALGWLVPQLPWTLIGIVWAYNLAWMFVLDFAKLGMNELFEGDVLMLHHRRLFGRVNRSLHPRPTG